MDVTPIVAGKLGYAGTAIRDARWSGYAVENGAQIRARAEYRESLASNFFASKSTAVPADVGHLTVAAGRFVSFEGNLVTGQRGGRSALVDFAAENLAVVNTRTNAVGRVELAAEDLQRFGAADLLIGGSRRKDGDLTNVTVGARTVTIDSGVKLQASALVLTATDTIEIKHIAHNRKGFATGALFAATWLIGKKGVFTMKDVLFKQ